MGIELNLSSPLVIAPDTREKSGAPVFELEHVFYEYSARLEALRDVSLTIRAGERVAVLGANGSGKSTLLKILDALYFPSRGTVRAFGETLDATVLEQDTRAFTFRRRVGLLFQDPDVQLFSPTVWDEVTFAPLHLGLARQEVIARAEWAMDLLGITKLRERAPHRLSGGEKKKVALASVLSLQPEVWLLDEPTASLDPRTTSRLLDFLDDLKREGKTIVTATHDLDIVEEISERVLMFCEEHEISADGDPRAILADEARLIECNLLHAHRHRHGAREHAHAHLHPQPHQHPHEG